MNTFSSISGFDQIFSNLDPSAKNIKRLNITSAKIESSDPSKKYIGMFKSLKMYISMGDGSNELLIASNSSISQKCGKQFSFGFE